MPSSQMTSAHHAHHRHMRGVFDAIDDDDHTKIKIVIKIAMKNKNRKRHYRPRKHAYSSCPPPCAIHTNISSGRIWPAHTCTHHIWSILSHPYGRIDDLRCTPVLRNHILPFGDGLGPAGQPGRCSTIWGDCTLCAVDRNKRRNVLEGAKRKGGIHDLPVTRMLFC